MRSHKRSTALCAPPLAWECYRRGPTENFRKRRCRRCCAAMRIPACARSRSWEAGNGTGAAGRGWNIACEPASKRWNRFTACRLRISEAESGGSADFQRRDDRLSMIDSPAVAGAYNFDGIRSIVDVGGGHGLLLATILERNPHLRGTLYDMPHVIEGANEWAAQARDGPLHARVRRYVFLGSGGRRCLHHETHHSRLAGRSVRQDTQSLPKRRESRRQTPRG